MNIIQFDIGDWSKDGHGMSDSFNIISNLDVTILRAAHLKFKKLYGFSIEAICYDSSYIGESIYTTLYLLDILNKSKYPSPAEISWNFNAYRFGYYIDEPKDILDIWLNCLKLVEPTFEYTLQKVERMVHSSKIFSDTVINCPGYGLYD